VNEIGDKEITHCLKVDSNTWIKEALGSAAYVCVFCKCFVFQLGGPYMLEAVHLQLHVMLYFTR